MDIQALIESYISSKRLAWAPKTLSSERYRLQSVAEHLTGDAEALWNVLGRYKPYTRNILWTRVVSFWDSFSPTNPYRLFRTQNARLFKNNYIQKTPEMSFEEALKRIDGIPDLAIRKRAKEILGSALRYAESVTHKDGYVVGKGGKAREVFVPVVEGPDYRGSYHRFWRELAKVGLKPHDLRKLCLSKLVESGANEFELRMVAGWSSLNTAASYIRVQKSRVKSLMAKVQRV